MKAEVCQLMERLIWLLEASKVQAANASSWEPWMDRYLEDLERHNGNATKAIEMSGLCRDTVYKHRRKNREFARQWAAITTAARRRRGRRRRLRDA